MVNPAEEISLQIGTEETWSGVVTVASDGGATDVQILEDCQHLIDLLNTYGEVAFWGIVDIFAYPLEADSGALSFSGAQILQNLGADIGVQFTMTNNDATPESEGDYFVKVRIPHTKAL